MPTKHSKKQTLVRRDKASRAKKKAPTVKFPDHLVALCRHDTFVDYFLMDEVFHGPTYLVIGNITKEQYTRWAHAEFGCQKEEPYFGSHAWCHPVEMTDGELRTVIVMLGEWRNTEEQRLTLQHECHHATTYQLHHIGLKHGPETEEVWTYYQEALVRQFIWAIKRPKQCMPHTQRKAPEPAKKGTLAKKPSRK